MPSGVAVPKAVDEVRITLVMDNLTDLTQHDTDVAKRLHYGTDPFTPSDRPPVLIAEHGFSAFVLARRGSEQGNVLFDSGISVDGVMHNLDVMQIGVDTFSAIVLSHGHADHANGLIGIGRRTGRKGLPLLLHPDSFLHRKLILPTGIEVKMPSPSRTSIQDNNIEVIEETGPSFLLDETMLVSGEVPRESSFETGLPYHYAERNGAWEPDPQVNDDQCIVLNVRGRGLVILTGCGHAGIINTIRNAQELTEEKKVYAVIGGFHLGGKYFENIIPQTVAELKKINPKYIIPAHCTGWNAKFQIAKAMPESFVEGSVGTTLVL
ncbi:MAG: MBL fold metallo-hydrolase [Candidatus Thorarchaeota archaeon]|nr:MAG: MBL fold metallo-hydrolase [Candidatus Thorarchaeota archaeon]